MAAKVVCISRTLAAGGEEIGQALAERLGWRVIDAEIIQRAAEKAGLDPGKVARTEQLYERSACINSWLEPDGQRAFGSMTTVYRALLDEIKRREGDVLAARVRLSRWRKMRIATQFLFRSMHEREARVGAT